MIGRTIGKYRVVEQIGRGGMGTVYRALDETLDRPVALKVVNAELMDDDRLQRFRSEAQTLARLSHPRIATIHELTRDERDLMMVMELVAGETCEHLLQRTGPLPISRAVNVCSQVLDALDYAHRRGVVHRDLKPANIMVTPTGDVKVMDFGVARVMGSVHLTTDGFMMGTPAYMSPEQVRGQEVDPRMDLYAAAVVFYRLLTQHLPFEAEQPMALLHAQLHDPPTPSRQFRADLPEWIDAVLARGLAKAPIDRFQTAAEFRAALEDGVTGQMTLSATPTAFRRSFDETVATPAPMRATSSVPSQAASARIEPVPSGRTEVTLTLGTRYLAGAGALLTLLVIGVGVLGYAALRRPTVVQPLASATVVPVAAPAPIAEPAGQPSAASAPPAPAAAAAAPSAVVSKVASALPAPAAQPAPAAPRAAKTDAAPSDAPASEPVAPVKAPALEPQSFGDVRALLPDGTKSREQDSLLSFDGDALTVRNRDTGAVIKTLSYKTVQALTYSNSRRPRASDRADVAALPASFGGSGFFLKTSKHWLTLQSKREFLILRLDDRNVRPVLQSIEARTGVKVDRPAKDDK